MIHLTGNFYGVEVPTGSTYLDCPEQDSGAAIIQYKFLNRWHTDALYLGKYKFLFLRSQATEEQAKMVVETIDYDIPTGPSNNYCGDWGTGYRDYVSINEPVNYVLNPLSSLSTLFQSLNLPGEVAVVKKIS